jgi:ribonuclease BN (tRNA processing enzyme)
VDGALKVTVLGASPVRANPGGACSGYLVEYRDRRVLLDCGPGSLARALTFGPAESIEAVIISHAHPDHFLDLVGLRYGALYGPVRPASLPTLYVGPGMRRVLDDVGVIFAPDGGFWEPFAIHEYDPLDGLQVAGLAVRFAETRHYVPCWAMRVESDRHTLVYTADTGPSEAVARLAQGADLLLCECTLPARKGYEHEWGHLAPEEAGAMAERAAAGRLLITHAWSEHAAELPEAVRTTYRGPVALARELETYVLD